MTSTTVQSTSKVNKQYHLTIDGDGKAIACTCGDCVYRKPHNCKHMRNHEQRRIEEARTNYWYYEMSLGVI